MDSTAYPALLGRGPDAPGTADASILADCSCAACGDTRLVLTRSWVERGLTRAGGDYERLAVRLARCRRCRRRERILPFDALPGKTHAVHVVVQAVGCLAQTGPCAAERRTGFSRQLVAAWARGLAARAADLFVLLRHRAVIATTATARTRCLVRFGAFRQEVRRRGRESPIGEFALSIVLVHHMRKAPSRDLGQRLRGSSDFAAWHDSALFITAGREHKTLTVEHRRAPAPGPFALRLVEQPTPHLELLDGTDGAPARETADDALQTDVLSLLRASPVPLSTQELRRTLARRKAAVVEALAVLQAAGRLERRASGWMATAHAPDPDGESQGELFPRSQP